MNEAHAREAGVDITLPRGAGPLTMAAVRRSVDGMSAAVDLSEVFVGFVDAPRWVAWRTEDGRKVPVSPVTGRNASATDPATWGSLKEALYARDERGLTGVGIVLGDGLGGVDLDACRDPETGELASWARKIIYAFASYAEISPSGTGLKIYALGAPAELPASTIPVDAPSMNGKRPAIECYVSGRYFAVTGQILDGVPDEIRDCGDLGGPWDEMVRALQEQAQSASAPHREEVPPTGATEFSPELTHVLEGKGKAGRLWRQGKAAGTDRSKNDAALAGTLGAMGFSDEDVEAALRSYPLGQVGQGALTGKAADRQLARLLGIAAAAREKREEGDVGQVQDPIERTVAPSPNGTGRPASQPRPTILIRQQLTAVTEESVAAIAARDDLGVFVRGRMLVTVGRDGSARERWLQRPPGSPVIIPLQHARLLGVLDAAAAFEKANERRKETTPARPPDWVAQQIAAQLEWPFRYLESVTETPTIRANGTILDTPGWDGETGILYDPPPGAVWEGVPDHPSREDVDGAVGVLLDPVRDFPFVADGDRSAYVAAILSLLARHRIGGPVPMFVIRTPTPGTGKSLLAFVIGLIGTGRTPPTMTMTFEGEELRKRITALAVAGTPLVLVDNMSGSIGSDALAAALTSTEWEDRLLGATQMIRVPLNTVWVGTGNNLTFRRTLGRRVVPIDMDAGVEVPEDRTGFRYSDLVQHVRDHRPQLVAAALTILRGFHVAGLPSHGGTRMGSFEAWDDFARSSVIWAGLADPAGTDEGGGRGRIRAQSDDDVEGLGVLLEELDSRFPNGAPFSTAQVLKLAKELEEFGSVLDLVAAPPRGGHATSNSIGGKFRDHKDRPVGGLVLRRLKRTWRVERTGD